VQHLGLNATKILGHLTGPTPARLAPLQASFHRHSSKFPSHSHGSGSVSLWTGRQPRPLVTYGLIVRTVSQRLYIPVLARNLPQPRLHPVSAT
jgi:hypothetical protein